MYAGNPIAYTVFCASDETSFPTDRMRRTMRALKHREAVRSASFDRQGSWGKLR